MKEHVIKRYWAIVEKKLNSLQTGDYKFIGESIVINISKEKILAINLDSIGYFMTRTPRNLFTHKKVYVPKFIMEKVYELYLKEKGYTIAFSKQIKLVRQNDETEK